MNNNQDNLNINPEINNQNNPNQYNSRYFNNSNGFITNQQQPQNIISQSQPEDLNKNIVPNQGINNQHNNFFNNNVNTNFNNNYNNNLNNSINQGFNTNIDIEMTRESILNNDEITAFQNQNKFITANQTNTALNDLNVEGEYNGLPKVDYSQDPKVMENIQSSKKKNTITITGEAKVFLIIIAVLLIFTFVMPIIFDFVRDIQY